MDIHRINIVNCRYGAFKQATIRKRTDPDTGKNTSWALVTMADSESASNVLSQRPLTFEGRALLDAGGQSEEIVTRHLNVNPFKKEIASTSTGAMGNVMIKDRGRLLAKINVVEQHALMKSRPSEDLDMPHCFIRICTDAKTRLAALKLEANNAKPLKTVNALEQLHIDFLRARRMQKNSSGQPSSSSSISEVSATLPMDLESCRSRFIEAACVHAHALLTKGEAGRAAAAVLGRAKHRGGRDAATRHAQELLRLALDACGAQTGKLRDMVLNGQAGCLSRRGQHHNALKLLGDVAASQIKRGEPLLERANGLLNRTCALLSARNFEGALVVAASKCAVALNEQLEENERQAMVNGFFQRALITTEWKSLAAMLCVALYAAAQAHLGLGQRREAISAVAEALRVAERWLTVEQGLARPRPLTIVLARELELLEMGGDAAVVSQLYR